MKPWRKAGWVIPPLENAELVANMEKVLDVYKRPYEAENPVVCMDESPQQLREEIREPIPTRPGKTAK